MIRAHRRLASVLCLLTGLAGPAWAQPSGTAPPAATPPSGEPINNSAMNAELFYQLLIGEINALGGEPGVGFQLILDAARKTSDPQLYRRATDIALQARSGESALQAARAWRQALPTSREANRYVLQILVGLNRASETAEPLRRELAATEPSDLPTAISSLPRFYQRASDRKAALAVVEQALSEHLTSQATGPSAWTTIGRMRAEAGDTAGALEAAQRGHALDPAAEGPAFLAINLMDPKQPQAEAIVRRHLQGKPRPELRMDFARALLNAQRYSEASQQLALLTAEKPDYAQAWLVRGLLEQQDRKTAEAEKSLQRYIELARPAATSEEDGAEARRGLTQAYLSLSELALQRKDDRAAEAWLARIENAEDMVNVQSRRAAILARQGRMAEARELIRNLPQTRPEDARLKLSAEVQLLRDNKQYKAAADLLREALAAQPDDVELTYDLAMVAEKLDDLTEMERLLRRVIALKPDHHHAYNALGYSLADRNLRLDEARRLILKALEYAPTDPYINDSLGWVEFRAGNLAEARRILEKAFSDRPDAEIAAHLGEVLWVAGDRTRALAIWRQGLSLAPDNDTLQETLRRLRVTP